MTILVQLVARFSFWLYLLLALIAVFFLRLFWVSRRQRASSIFALERESYGATMARSAIGFLVALALGSGVYYVSNILVEEVPLPVETPTPTPIVILPPTPTPPPLLPTPTPSPTPQPRPTPPPQLTEEAPTPEPALGVPANCPNPGVQIAQPGTGAQVNGVIQLVGSASIENFDYYKFEFRAAGGDWNFIQHFETPVIGGILGAWNTDTVPPGEYELRLVVVDATGNFPEPCTLQLTIKP
ncbi:MAG: hypothetical protein ACE5H9_01495 [Anaerolineae bacterium]